MPVKQGPRDVPAVLTVNVNTAEPEKVHVPARGKSVPVAKCLTENVRGTVPVVAKMANHVR
ncbi:MAG: hypothetical protein AMK70_07310 [Nitrospira bacterium SG8_35_1]|nr:MAG: hypothetical protein AMK70_07310 [Nitrospira bacterium SG8_35_1]